jgi:hypothetical protein
MSADEFIGRKAGVDLNGEPARLGEFDSAGHIVGYIDDKGNCWENLRERDCSMSAGRYLDALSDFRAGRRRTEPDAEVMAKTTCVDPAHVEAAVKECHEQARAFTMLRKANTVRSAEQFVDRLIEEVGIDTLAELLGIPPPEEQEED